MAIGWTGAQSAGKSQMMAVHAVKILYRNIAWMKKREELGLPAYPRTMAFDSPMSPAFVAKVEEAGMKYIHFHQLTDVMPLVEIDIFIHEIISWFPQRGSEALSPEQSEFLSQANKEGIQIYFCCQDFSQAHKSFRMHVTDIKLVVKIVGSERPMRSAPPVKHIWGLVLYWDLDPKTFKGDNVTIEREGYIPALYFINKEDTELYDTSYRVRGLKRPPKNFVPQEYHYLDDAGKIEKIVKKHVPR